MLPRDLPPKETVWGHFRAFRDDGTLERIRLALNKKVRLKVGKQETPSVLIADSQSVKTTLKGGIGVSTGASKSKGANVTFK